MLPSAVCLLSLSHSIRVTFICIFHWWHPSIKRCCKLKRGDLRLHTWQNRVIVFAVSQWNKTRCVGSSFQGVIQFKRILIQRRCGNENSERYIYSAFQKSLNKTKYFLTISNNVLILNALYKQNGSKNRPNETLGLIFDPYCLIPSISCCWKLVVLRGITWIMWLYKFCKFYKLSKNIWMALLLFD